MNITDKYAVSKKVTNTASYTVISGAVMLIAGLVLAIFLDWSVVSSYKDLLFPALAGFIYGSQYFAYYYLFSKEDASSIIGLLYLYPIMVAILSFFFLNERFSLLTYAGMGLVILGAIMLSTRINNLKKGVTKWLIASMIVLVGLHEFFIKIATTKLPEFNGLAVGLISIGLTLLAGLFHTSTRRGIRGEFKNLKWLVLSEGFAFGGLATIYFAMAGLPATIVATIAATQPLIVLFLEKLCHAAGLGICSDQPLLAKLIPISIMVLGLLMLYEIV